MEKDFGIIHDQVLLVGEANFSFAISLLKHSTSGKFITATCFESYGNLKSIYGDCLDKNLEILKDLGVQSICFEIDACTLGDYFCRNSFSKIIFMFPHVCKKSNLKLNRKLLASFLISSHCVLKPDGAIYLTLAKGQGGTKFEQTNRPISNDNWQLLRIANETGYLLTDVQPFNADDYDYYKCTGFRRSSKGFNLIGSLVHRLQLSMLSQKYDSSDGIEVHSTNNYELDSGHLHKYLVKSISLYNDDILDEMASHPLIYLKQKLVSCLNQKCFETKIGLNIYDQNKMTDFVSIHLNSKPSEFDTKQCYRLNGAHLNFLNKNLNLSLADCCLFTRNTLHDPTLLSRFTDKNAIHVIGGLILTTRDLSDKSELNNYSYSMLFCFDKNGDVAEVSLEAIILRVLAEIFAYYKFDRQFEIVKIDNRFVLRTCQNQWNIFKMLHDTENIVCELDLSGLCLILSDETDKRLIYSEDKRLISNDHKVKQQIIQTVQYKHDISFWYNTDQPIDCRDLYDVVRDVCGSLVKTIDLIDSGFTQMDKSSACFRLVYESCDTALSFKQTNVLQNELRQSLKQRLNLVLR